MKINCPPPKTLTLISVLLISRIQGVYSQQFSISDSLKNKTFDELHNNIINSKANKGKIYATTYIYKAKNEKDTIELANAYANFVHFISPKTALKYSDSIIAITKNKNHFKFPGHGYMLKGVFNFKVGNYNIAIENYLIALEYANKNKNLEQQFYLNNQIGQFKMFWGDYDEGLKIFKSQLKKYLKIKGELVNKNILYFNLIFNLSNSYTLTKKIDSALFYSKIGLQKSLNVHNADYYYLFVAQLGEIAYHQNNFKSALDSLNKAFPYEESNNGLLNNFYYRGLIYNKQHNNKESIFHFKKADSIYNISNDVVPEVRNIQEHLLNYYQKNNDIANQLKYVKRLLYVDSIIDNTREKLGKTLFKKYDTPLLLLEKEKLIRDLKFKERKSTFLIFGLATLVILMSVLFIGYSIKQRILKERFKKLISNKKQKKSPLVSIKQTTNNPNGISKKLAKKILASLDEFEKNNSYLDNNLTLNSLSKEFQTNSNYLSKIINTYKEKNYSTYISDLRIDYCIEKLTTNTTFRKYTITAIAFEIGFNNVESFSKTFYKNTGIYPSFFIKELIKKGR